MSSFSSGLVYQNSGGWNAHGDALYVTNRSFIYYIGDHGSTLQVEIPQGFETDLTSIPRFLRWWLQRDGPWVQAAVVHDWLYEQACVQRWLADYVFFEASGVAIEGTPRVSRFTRLALYVGVRIGGWRAYRRYLRARLET